MARFRVYIKPFDDAGNYLDDFIEVTRDVAQLGDIKQAIDNNEYDVGVIKNSGFNIILRNDEGSYSDVTEVRSIFRYARKGSIIKITWDVRNYDLICGFFAAGDEPIGGEVVLFQGLLNEVSSTADIARQQATFACLGFDSLLDELEVPFGDFSPGDTFSEILLGSIDQSPFNSHITVDASNITPGTDMSADSVDGLQNKTVGEILKNVLLVANSVLFIKNDTVYVTDRTCSDATMYTFYGQASINGIENIINIPKYKDGMNRVFNFWTWAVDGVTTFAKDTSSIVLYKVQSKSISSDLIADGSTAKIQTILNANRTEFSFPKVELELETPMDYDVIALNILDRVNIDYPTIYIPYDNNPLPRYNVDVYDGTARYPYGQWALTINSSDSFKIMQKKINVSKQTITFTLREV